jgi:hypothetical protein
MSVAVARVRPARGDADSDIVLVAERIVAEARPRTDLTTEDT